MVVIGCALDGPFYDAFDGTLDLGATPLTTMGGFDMFLAKIRIE